MANYATRRGEIDLICRDQDCLVFVEVKTRSSEEWSRPAAAVTQRKRQKVFRAALEYLRLLEDPRVKIRFDIVEVLVGAGKKEIRHLPNAFSMRGRSMYGSVEPGPRRPGSP
jgi:putative endonuclease